MLNMKEKAFLGLCIPLAVGLTASLILASRTYEVKLVANPGGQRIEAPAGKPFNISCQGIGDDESKFALMKWLNSEGNVIADGNPGVVKTKNNALFLAFTHPKTEDSGTYKCTAVYDNEHNLQYVVSINFYGPRPEFELPFENITATEGERVEVFCSAVGESPITYTWYNQNEDTIQQLAGLPIYASNSGNGSWLIIQEMERQYQGMYTCSASNNHGLSSKLYSLRFTPRNGNDTSNETALFRHAHVVNISASSVEFSIDVSGPVRYIEVKYSEIRNSTEYSTRLLRTSWDLYSIEDLIPSGLYSFQFRTIPSEDDNWSRVYNVTLLPDAPEVILRGLEKGIIKLEYFRTFEDFMRKTIDSYEIKYYTVGMEGGSRWVPSTCAITIQLPSCAPSAYTIAGLSQNVYYQLELRAHTASGYGEPALQKVFLSG